MADDVTGAARLLEYARAWHDAGCAVIPSHEDGRKRPFAAWLQYQERRPTWEQVEAWVSSGRYSGIGIITGSASGNVEMIELEGPVQSALENIEALRVNADRLGCGELLRRVLTGCVEQSGGGGMHVIVRVEDGPALGNTKLASRAGKVLAETRGEGGFVIVAPTPARQGHADGSVYMLVAGTRPESIASITSAERDLLHQLITMTLDEPEPRVTRPEAAAAPTASRASDGTAPWEEWSAATSWAAILAPIGWTATHTASDGRTHWVRPGKDPRDGASATTLEDGPMYVFSTSTSLPPLVGMSKQYVVAHLRHDGDLGAFTRDLVAQGWGTPLTPPPLTPWQGPTASDASDGSAQGLPVQAVRPEDPYERAVAQKYAELRVLDDARSRLALDQLGATPPLEGLSLSDFLAEPDEEIQYVIEGLWPIDGRVLLAAAAKAGKTTLIVNNLIRSLVDGEPFLGRIPVPAFPGRVAFFNMEVSASTLRRWTRDADISDTDAVVILNLRGRASALLLSTPQGRRRLAQWLRDHGIALVILDPLAPLLAAHGLDENSNTDVALFFSWWAETLVLAGISNDLIVHHTGHAGDRSRGASRLLDEPDAVWTLTKDKPASEEEDFAGLTPVRHLSAYGRDVDLPAEALDFDPRTRRLTLTGRDPHQARREMTGLRAREAILAYVAEHDGATTRDIKYAAGVGRDYLTVLSQLIREGRLDTSIGSRRTVHHHLPTSREVR
jgi:hypothetical protein